MPDSISAKLVFDDSSQLGAFRLHMWHRYKNWLILRTGLSILLVLVGFILLIAHGANPMPLLMVMIGTFALLRPMIWKIMHSRNLRKIPGFGETVVYTFTAEGVAIHGEKKQAQMSWTQLFEAVSTKHGLLLYHGKKSYTWVPNSAFDTDEDYQEVSSWLSQKTAATN